MCVVRKAWINLFRASFSCCQHSLKRSRRLWFRVVSWPIKFAEVQVSTGKMPTYLHQTAKSLSTSVSLAIISKQSCFKQMERQYVYGKNKKIRAKLLWGPISERASFPSGWNSLLRFGFEILIPILRRKNLLTLFVFHLRSVPLSFWNPKRHPSLTRVESSLRYLSVRWCVVLCALFHPSTPILATKSGPCWGCLRLMLL